MFRPKHLLLGVALATLSMSYVAADPRSLDIVAPWEITSADPSTSGYVFGRMQVAETLVDTDDAGQPAPGFAEAWSQDEDGLTWRFTIRQGALFHDGSDVTATATEVSSWA